jgi:hypothetical protein
LPAWREELRVAHGPVLLTAQAWRAGEKLVRGCVTEVKEKRKGREEKKGGDGRDSISTLLVTTHARTAKVCINYHVAHVSYSEDAR